jgi:hypothetical protein
MDGLVSTGNEFPNTILKIILFNQKIFDDYFINILKSVVDKERVIFDSEGRRNSINHSTCNHMVPCLQYFSNSNNPG